MRTIVLIVAAWSASNCLAQPGPWPIERQNRYGTSCAVEGPHLDLVTTPWVSHVLASGYPVSHGPSIGPDGIAYFGDWVDNRVYKFDTQSGAVLGSFLTNRFVTCVPALTSLQNLVAGSDGAVFGIDTAIMDFNWFLLDTQYLGGSVNIGPDGDIVFASSNGTACRRNPLTGQAVWVVSGFGAPRGSMVFTRDDQKVVFAHGTLVTALNYSDGSHVWTVNLGSLASSPSTSPSGRILVGCDAGTVFALSPLTGSTAWTWGTLGEVRGAAAFSPDGTVAYVPSYDHRIYALRVTDGVRLWSFTTTMWCETTPTVDTHGRIYVHNKNGDLYCISSMGAQIWKVHLPGESRGPMTIGPDATLYVGFTGSSAGLAVIRQQSTSVAPDSLVMEQGVLASGGLAEILSSDDMWAVFDRDPYGARLSAIQTIVTGRTAYRPIVQLKVEVESHGEGIDRQLQLWNFATGSWNTIHSGVESALDATTFVTVNNAQPYADASGTLRLRIIWTNNVATGARTFKTYLDYVRFHVVPQFAL